MRTTVTLDDELYEEARRIAFETRQTLGAVINELLGEGLMARKAPKPTRTLGALRGSIHIADDFDETPLDVREALDKAIEPERE